MSKMSKMDKKNGKSANPLFPGCIIYDIIHIYFNFRSKNKTPIIK
jgi:hypothetical protein